MKKKMKKISVILFALLGVVFFNSCKDDTEEKKPTTTTTNIFTELKGYTGKTYEEVSLTIQSKGFTLSGTESEDGTIIYFFSNSDNSYKYTIGEYNDTIALVGYEIINNNKDVLHSNFEKNSLFAVSFVGNNPLVFYSSDFQLNNPESQLETFEQRSDFLTAYNQNKSSIIYSSETWLTPAELVGIEFSYNELDGNYSVAYYGDFALMPIFMKSNKKSVFEILHNKK